MADPIIPLPIVEHGERRLRFPVVDVDARTAPSAIRNWQASQPADVPQVQRLIDALRRVDDAARLVVERIALGEPAAGLREQADRLEDQRAAIRRQLLGS